MSAPHQREQRQYALMADTLRGFRSNRIGLGRLVNDLDALWNELELASPEWRSSFRVHWGTLEQAHAVALDRGGGGVPDDLRGLVADAVDALTLLVGDAWRPADDPPP